MLTPEGEPLSAEFFSPRVLRAAPEELEPELEKLANLNGSLKEKVAQIEAQIIREALIRHRWNKTKVAEELGLSRVGLRQKMERFGLTEITEKIAI